MTIRHEAAVLANSLWTASANRLPDYPPLQGEAKADVAIVGGGYTGLSAALHLAEQGADVVLLEAEQPGWGASGRNGGQVIAGLKHDPEEIEARFGPDVGGSMLRLAGGAPDLVFSLIDRLAIDCAPLRAGWVHPAHNGPGLERAHHRAEQWRRRGAPVESLTREQMAKLTGSEVYLGGLLDRRGGAIHPLNYALGLAEAATAAGARLHGQSRVTRWEKDSRGFVLHGGQGSLKSSHVLVCTNGYTDSLLDPLRRSVVAVRSVQVATKPLSEELRRSILPQGQVASDTRRLLLYYRQDPAGRLIMGGRGAYGESGIKAQLQRLRKAACSLYPQLDRVEWEYHWGGFVAMTGDHLPHIHELAPGMIAALGYNGRGIAMATALGRVLAERAAGASDSELAWPVSGVRPLPFHALRRPAVTVIGGWYQLRDRVGF